MWLEETVSRLRSGGSVPLDAHMANTAMRARTRPPLAVVTASPSGAGRTAVARLPSKIWAPRASSRSRSPNASRAGWTFALAGTYTPERNTGESQRARAAAASWASTVVPSTPSAAAPSCAGAVETHSSPPRRYHASTPSASHHAPIASTVSRAASVHAVAAASPYAATSVGRLMSMLDTNPPLRPLGPCPQRPASSSTTRASGSASSRCHAVHMPV
jgi:hypothetical protein